MTDTATPDLGQVRKVGTDEGWTTYRAYVVATSGDLSGEDIRAVWDRLPDWKREPWAAVRAEVERQYQPLLAVLDVWKVAVREEAWGERSPLSLLNVELDVTAALAALQGEAESAVSEAGILTEDTGVRGSG